MIVIDVLIVEDNPHSRQALGRLLLAWGYRVMGATTLEEARTLIGQVRPVHCFVDKNLGVDDGRDFIAEVKARYPDCRAFLWTGDIAAIEEFKAGDSPADDLLTKPAPDEADMGSIRRMLEPPLSPPDGSCP